jgi:hypothetical protein
MFLQDLGVAGGVDRVHKVKGGDGIGGGGHGFADAVAVAVIDDADGLARLRALDEAVFEVIPVGLVHRETECDQGVAVLSRAYKNLPSLLLSNPLMRGAKPKILAECASTV